MVASLAVEVSSREMKKNWQMPKLSEAVTGPHHGRSARRNTRSMSDIEMLRHLRPRASTKRCGYELDRNPRAPTRLARSHWMK